MACQTALSNLIRDHISPPSQATSIEYWTRDILHLMEVVISAATLFILATVAFGLFTFQDTLPAYILLFINTLAWWGSRHGGWHWARYFPALLCLLFGFYGSIISGSNNSGLFYALAVLLAGMLISRFSQWVIVIGSITFMGLVPILQGRGVFYAHLPYLITTSFLLIGISLLRWYYESHLVQAIAETFQANQKLSEEIELRRRTEDILRQKETQLRRLTDNTIDLMCEIAPDGTIRYASPSYQVKLGYAPETLLGTNVFDLVLPEDRPSARQTAKTVVEKREPGIVELRCRHADGHLVTFETIGSPVFLESGDLDGIVLFSRDITQQTLAEAALRESEAKFRAIITSIPMGMHMYTLRDDDQLEFTGYNPSADRILRIKHVELIGRTLGEAFPGWIGSDVPAQYCEIARHGNSWERQEVFYQSDDIHGTFEIRAFQTSPNKMATIFLNISEHIQAAEALKQSEEKFSKSFSISPDSISINRLSDGLYIDVNPAFCRHTGYSRKEAIGQTTDDLQIWGSPPDRLRFRKVLCETGVVENMETKFRHKGGTIITGLISARVLEFNGEKCLLSITRNISDRIQSEQALREAHNGLEDAYEATLQGWVRALELREHETADHSRRVVELTLTMAKELGFTDESLPDIHRGALLHDIGKIGVPDNILLKPGPLSPEEWTIMRNHPRYALDLLMQIPYLQRSIAIPYCHHERWDGTGYPRGIAREQIPLAARIFAVVDVYDALLSNRPYRRAWSIEDVTRYLIDQKGKQFDPLIVDCFLALNAREKTNEEKRSSEYRPVR